MSDSTRAEDADNNMEYGTKHAADYLTLKAHEHGYTNIQFDAHGVITLANTSALKSSKSAGKNGQYKFTLVDLQDYVERVYPKHDDSTSQPTPTPTPTPTILPAYHSAHESVRKQAFKQLLEREPLWFMSGLMLSAFMAGVGAILFVVPELRTWIGPNYINSKQPLASESVTDIIQLLAKTPADSELSEQIKVMVSQKAGVFKNLTQELDDGVLSLIRTVKPDDKTGIKLRDMVKKGVGPFKPFEKTVKLRFVNANVDVNNSQLEKVKNFNAGACKDDFAYGSTIHIYAPEVDLALIDSKNFALHTFFAGAETTFDCENDTMDTPTIWINSDEFASSFSVDSAKIKQIEEFVVADVRIDLQPVVLIPNSSSTRK